MKLEVWRVLAASILYQPQLLAEYAAECRLSALGEPQPQWDMYYAMEKQGLSKAFAVYVADTTQMVGFANVLTSVLPHYGVKAVVVESIFVGKQWRDTRAGAALIQEIERYAREHDCKAVLYSAVAGSALEAVLAKRFERTNVVYCQPLGADARADSVGDGLVRPDPNASAD